MLGWKECPDNVDQNKRYAVDVENSRFVTKTAIGGDSCTVIGNTPIPFNTAASWYIKVHKSKNNNSDGIYIGVAPFDISQNKSSNHNKCGWYFDCYGSTLCSGPPHAYDHMFYGQWKANGQYVRTEDDVGVVINTVSGELSFVLNGISQGIAYDGIPLDEPLVPCVLLCYEGDSVELYASEVKENVDSFVPVPSNITTKRTTWDSITFAWDDASNTSFYQIDINNSMRFETTSMNIFEKRKLLPETEYSFRVRGIRGSSVSEWSDAVRERTQKIPEFSGCTWKECPDDADEICSLDLNNPRVTIKSDGDTKLCTAIGNKPLPLGRITSWSTKILKSRSNNGENIFVGVAPFDIDYGNKKNHVTYGWYFDCHESKLFSGPPHRCKGKEYGPKRGKGEYVHVGDCIGTIVDTMLGLISFALNGVDLGVAYEGIPLDKPLVPCVLLKNRGDSVELDTSEVEENVSNSIVVPIDIVAESEWDSITLTWDTVDNASFYQIEVDGSRSWDASLINTFTKGRLTESTEHTFRIRAVVGNSVSEWSGAVRERTQKIPEFSGCTWKECPDNVDEKYSLDMNNPGVAIKSGGDTKLCTAIGDKPLPLGRITSWSTKILKSRSNNGENIFVGVAPFNINQGADNRSSCGWYFDCHESKLFSGPPHRCKGKEYGPKRGRGEYVHVGDRIGIIADTMLGLVSFALNEVDLGVAYEGIPLDKPLVPCVLLKNRGDSVELDASEVEETKVDYSIPVPSEITVWSDTWDSITLAWDTVKGASFYQIEVDGSGYLNISTKNHFTKRGFFAGTEHYARIRAVRGNSVSEWSNIVCGRVQEEFFEAGWWRECPTTINDERKYFTDENNPRTAIKKRGSEKNRSTVVWNMLFPPHAVISWGARIFKSKGGNSKCTYVGVAPFDIDQNDNLNHEKCGWYFDCYGSKLWSGPPHNYRGKECGPRRRDRKLNLARDIVGVVMDTINGVLSFALNGVNLGVVYEGIPLDKPLAPCIILVDKNDSIEFDIFETNEDEADHSVSVPLNIRIVRTTWDSITIAWDAVEGASFYQVGHGTNRFWNITSDTKCTINELVSATGYDLMVRTVDKHGKMSEWSGIIREYTRKPYVDQWLWKECSDDVESKNEYSVDDDNPRIAAKINATNWCTIIGNTPIPPRKTTAWGIKILNSKDKNGDGICVGVAPFSIDQNGDNCMKCGWYLNCYDSTLCSGPKQNHNHKEYGPRKKKEGQYVRIGDIIGVVMDTMRGEISFILNRVNPGVAYEGIPLDKPLVPCVILKTQGDSVELIVGEDETDNENNKGAKNTKKHNKDNKDCIIS